MDERRTVTVLFCDVVGSTAITERLEDDEAWAEIIREALPIMIEPVERFGGHVSRLLGDAILALFGAPVAHEDDPRRAVLAGLAILEALESYRAAVRRDYGVDFDVRIGINTGLLVVGDFGAGRATEYTAMGDAINVAAKIQEVADPGTVLVAGPTFSSTKDFFEYEPKGPIEVKGKSEPVKVYRAIASVPESGQLRGNLGLATPMVGRESEFALLKQALSGLGDGLGGIIAVVGEAGLGKTRLIAEARRVWLQGGEEESRPEQTWIEDRLASYEAAQPYSLFRERLRIGFGIDVPASRDGSAIAGHELHGAFSDEERDRAGQIVRMLYSPASDAHAPGLIEGDALRRELVDLAVRVWQAWMDRFGPSVYVIDDMHWLDPASSELLETLLDRLSDLPILVLMAFRPEPSSPAWRVSRRLATRFPDGYQELTLDPLDAEQLQSLVTAILSEAPLPRSLGAAVLAKAEGNPLFVEELIRSLIDQGIVVFEPQGMRIATGHSPESIKLPDTLRGLLQGRIDRLDPSARQTLQRAAVIGRSFSRSVLSEISSTPDELDGDLAALLGAGLIEQSDGEYRFHHALIWEAARDGLVRRHSRQLHRQVGEAIERIHQERIEEHFGLLGYHFHAARDARAVDYARKAGNQALDVYAPAEALQHYNRAIEIAELHEIADPLFELHRQRGRAYEILGDFLQARRDLERALALAQETGDVACEWDSLLALGMLWSERNYERTREYFQRAHDLASDRGDQLMLAHSLNRLGNWYLNADEPARGLRFHQQALEIFRIHDDRQGVSETLDLLGMLHTLSGDAITATDSYRQAARLFRELDNRAGLASSLVTLSLRSATLQSDHIANHDDPLQVSQQDVEEALNIAREIGWRAGESYALWALGFLLASRGLYDEAFEAAGAGLTVATEIEHRQWMSASQCAIGAIYLDLLAWERAVEHLEPALELAARTGSQHWIGSAAGLLARALIGAGELDRAEALLAEIPDPRAAHRTVAQRHVCCARTELLLARGLAEAALALVTEAIELSPHSSRRPIIRLAYLQGSARVALGDTDRATAELRAALRVASQQGAAGLSWRLHAALAHAATTSGNTDVAERERSAAREIFMRVASKIGDSELQTQFLDRAERRLSRLTP